MKSSYKTTQFANFFPKTHLQLIKILQDYKNNNFISETEYTLLRPHGSKFPPARFYGLHKIYKNNMPIHLIVSAGGTATYNTTKFISKILQNYCSKTSSFVKDSTDFIQKNKHLSIKPKEETLVSFDVSAVFTSIPVSVVGTDGLPILDMLTKPTPNSIESTVYRNPPTQIGT